MRKCVARDAVFLGACALIVGCGKGGGNTDSAMKASTDSMTTRKDSTSTTTTTPVLTDANIAAILDEANAADSSAGKIASTKGTSTAVKDFGRQMMRDHHSLRKQGQDLVKKLNVTPQLPAGDNSEATAKAWQDSLTAMAKGAPWDKTYMDHEVAYHQAVLQTAQTAQGAAQNAELKALITAAIPAVQAHLDKATSVQTKLSSGGTMADTTKMGLKRGGMKKGAAKTP